MREIRYYPLVDMDTDGTEKVPMFFSTDKETVKKHHPFYLEETIHGVFRLISRDGTPTKDTASVHCPLCGKPLTIMGRSINAVRQNLYTCRHCNH